MHRWRASWLGIVCACTLPVAATRVRADTIVLKNGRRINALSVTDQGDKIRYETAAGTLTLPKGIVDHIEHGANGPLPAGSPDALAMTAPDVAMAPPELSSKKAEIESRLIHDGAVDRGYL